MPKSGTFNPVDASDVSLFTSSNPGYMNQGTNAALATGTNTIGYTKANPAFTATYGWDVEWCTGAGPDTIGAHGPLNCGAIVLCQTTANARTLTVKDNATTVMILNTPAAIGTTVVTFPAPGLEFATSMVCTPDNTDLEYAVLYRE
jgi:hypothetical protein